MDAIRQNELYAKIYTEPTKIGGREEHEVLSLDQRIHSLENKLNSLIAFLSPLGLSKSPGSTETTRDTNSSPDGSIHGSAPVSNQNPVARILTQENRDADDMQPYAAWAFLLGKRAVLLETADMDMNPVSRRHAKDQIGTIKGIALADGPFGVAADVALEFPMMVDGGHECYGVTEKRRGLWFGFKHIEVIYEGEYGDES